MNNLDIRQNLDSLLKQLGEEKSIDVAEKIISELVGILGIKVSDRFLLNVPRIDAELSRFMLAPGFGRQAAAYDIPNDHGDLIDLKLFWVKKLSKTNLSWLIGITPNFEDSEANDYKNISIDFVVPESGDSVNILLSSKFKIRSLELKGHITHTQFEIFESWRKDILSSIQSSQKDKKIIHSKLWDSFDFEPINRAFYFELVESFSLLVHHLERGVGRKPAVMFTTRLIGRLLFLWFLKKKNYINNKCGYFDVNDFSDQTSYYKSKLEILFFEILNREISERDNFDVVTPYLNGGLFEISETDFYKSDKLTFPDAYFINLFKILNKYNFTVDESSPEFQHVAIDPEMLGRIFESLLAEQVDEITGSNKKKVTGAFYTPREIVSFMCEESLIEFLKRKVPEGHDRDLRIQELIRLPETIFRDQDQNKRRDWKPYAQSIIDALSGSSSNEPLTILDPAVGSGAFPMGMLHLLVKVFGRLDPKYEKNIAILKREILSRSLYGADIEQTAIEICRLRAWLSIIVDIPEGGRVEPLPNLDFKFTCANALIPLEEERQASLLADHLLKNKLMTIRNEYFQASNKKNKKKLQNEYESLTHHEGLFDSARTKQLKSYRPFDINSTSNFYDPELHHGLSHFDIVIGNPPYVQIQKFSKQDIQKKLQDVGYESFSKTGDLYCLFYEKGINLLKNHGLLTFITSNKWMRAAYGEKIRALFLKNNPLLLIDLGSNVFENATVDTNILLISNEQNQNQLTAITLNNKWDQGSDLTNLVSANSIKLSNLSSGAWSIDGVIQQQIMSKILKQGKKIKDLDIQIYRAILTGLNEAFIVDETIRDQLLLDDPKSIDVIKPIYRGKDISRYSLVNSRMYLLMTGFDADIPKNYPAIYKHLVQFKEKAKKRDDQGKDWYNLRACGYYDAFEKDKIVWGNISYDSAFTILHKGLYLNAPANLMLSKTLNIYYLLGCLNSSIFNWEFKRHGIFLGSAYEWKKQYVEQIHIPLISQGSADLQEQVVEKVKAILEIKKRDAKSSTFDLENQINQIIYKIYHLNEEEINVIEKSDTKTK